MYRHWPTAAQYEIEAVMKDMPEGASWQDRRRRLRSHASIFHGGTSHGKKVWARECRRYLETKGMPPRRPQDASPLSKQGQRLLDPDIIFPFRQ